MSDKPSIRFAGPQDIDAIMRIYAQRFDSMDDPSIAYSLSDWEYYLLNKGNSIILVTELDGCIIGLVFAYDMGIWGYVENLVVDTDHRKKGYASAMCECLMEMGKQRGWRLIEACYYEEMESMKNALQAMGWLDGDITTRWVFKEIA